MKPILILSLALLLVGCGEAEDYARYSDRHVVILRKISHRPNVARYYFEVGRAIGRGSERESYSSYFYFDGGSTELVTRCISPTKATAPIPSTERTEMQLEKESE